MATADFELSMEIDAGLDDLLKIIDVLKDYTSHKKDVYFTNIVLDKDHKKYQLDSLSEDELKEVLTSGEDSLGVEALGPYGHFSFLEDIKLFKDMADAAPYAFIDAEITGSTSYTEQSMHATLKDTTLHTKVFFVNTDEETEMYLDYVTDVLPYDEFIDLFKVDDIEYEDYVDFMGDLLLFKEESISDIDYNEFTDLLFAECGIDEDHYNDVVRDLDIMSYGEFMDEHDLSDINEFDYQPLNK